ncbi:MAG TPA: hypothetical protein PLQ21_01525, partial [Candidatus Kapabacteria bacterium]|nr:hypothetical protein [Candidatus Kapabacteria bacterium]
GEDNTASGWYSFVGGGKDNTASGDWYSFVGGGADNTAFGLISFVGGGSVNTASGGHSFVGGGEDNTASGWYSFVGGGSVNTASGGHSFVGGGEDNTASGWYSFVGGGKENTASGDWYSFVGGGKENTASGWYSFVGGGYGNTASGDLSVIPGGRGLILDANANRSFGFHANNVDGTRNMTISAANTAVFGNVDFWLANNDNSPRSLRFYEQYNAAGNFPNGTNYVGFRAPNNVSADITYTLPVSAPTNNGQVLSSTTEGVLSWAHDGIINFTSNRNTGVPNAIVPVHQLSASGGEISIDIAISSKGDGAIMADMPDGTSTGGNKRGTNAVDWQMSRVNANQVASGASSVIMGGGSNRAGGLGATVGGGFLNNADGYNSTIDGGEQNTTSGHCSSISGGYNNTAGSWASVISGGSENIANGEFASISGGENNTVTGYYSSIIGGRGLTLHNDGSVGYLGNNFFGYRNMTISAANTAVFGNVDFWLANNDNSPRSLRFYEQYNAEGNFPNGTNYVGFRAPNNISADITYTLPASAPTSNGQVLSSTTAGVLSWITPSGGDTVTMGGDVSGTFSNLQIVANAVGSAEISDNAILTSKIADGNITLSKISQSGATNGQVLKWNGSAWSPSGDNSGMVNFSETRTVSAPNETRPVHQLSVVGSEANIDMALSPKGEGALTAHSANNALSGGNKRGQYAVDFQTVRSAATQVASGSRSSIGGGEQNTASGGYSRVGGGYANIASGSNSAVSGGLWNTASSLDAVISGGRSNTASGMASTVAGGESNLASAEYSFVGGGVGNQATGARSSVLGGYNNRSQSSYSVVLGGTGMTLNGAASNSFGFLGANAGNNNMTIAAANTGVLGNVNLWLANNDGNAREIRFYEPNSATGTFPATGVFYTAFKAQAQDSSYTYTLPSSAPISNGQVLTASTGGTMSWATKSLKITVNNFDPDEVNATSFANFTVTANGVTTTDVISLHRVGGFGNLIVASAYVNTNNQVTIRVYNPTASPVNLGAENIIIGVIRE